MQAVILAAGKGKRLRPFTLTRSKGMAPIVGKPMCVRVIDTLIAANIKKFVVVVGPDDTELENYLQETFSHDTSLHFEFVVQNERLGMAHALSCAKSLITESFILSAADSIISPKTVNALIETFKVSEAKMVLTLLPVAPEKVTKTGIVAFDNVGKVMRIVEKPSLEEAPSAISSLPIYAFSTIVFDYLPKVPLSARGEYELQDAIQMLINDYGSMPNVLADYRLDLTTLDDLLSINMKYLKELDKNVILSVIPTNCKILDYVYIGKNVKLEDMCVVGPNVFLETGAHIKQGATLKDCIVLSGGVVEKGQSANNTVVISDNA